jgi:hypothetical protein
MIWSKLWKERLIQLIEEVEIIKPKSKMTALKELWDKKYPHLKNITRQALWVSGRNFQEKGATSPIRPRRTKKLEENQEKVRENEAEATEGTTERMPQTVSDQIEQQEEKCQMSWESPERSCGLVKQDGQVREEDKEKDNEIQTSHILVEVQNLKTQEQGETTEQETKMQEMLEIKRENIEPEVQVDKENQDEAAQMENNNDEEMVMWEKVFQSELKKNMDWGKGKNIESRKPLKKIQLEAKEIAILNKTVWKWAEPDIKNMLDISNALYSVGKTVEFMKATKEECKNSGGKKCQQNSPRKNRTLRKLEEKIKGQKRIASWTECEMQRRRQGRKSTWKEAQICQQLAYVGNEGKSTIKNSQLMELKVKSIDMIHMLQVKLKAKEKTVLRRTNNGLFESSEKSFYRKMEEVELTGDAPSLEAVHKYWSEIWEVEKEINPAEKWMNEVEQDLKKRILTKHTPKLIDFGQWTKLVTKRKNWTSPGPDGVQNYWVKKITALWTKQIKYIADFQECKTQIEAWMGEGRTVLIPKSTDLSKIEKYRPITCLNSLYKLMTAVVASDVQDYLIENKLWDMQQKGTRKGILGTMDNLLVDRAIHEESKEYQRNLAVAYYDYEKAYDSTPHSWQIKCFKMCQIDEKVIHILEQLHQIWKTRLELWEKGKMLKSEQIKFKCGFFQGDAFSPVGFCITEIPLSVLLEKMPGYMMGEQNLRNTKINRFYFIDDLKIVQGSEADLQRANSLIGKVSTAMGMKFGISKCAEIVYRRGKMVKAEGLELKEGLVKALNPEEDEYYTFLGIEEGDGQMDTLVKKRVSEKCYALASELCSMELFERNLVKAINSKAMATVRYTMNICHFTKSELREFDVKMRKILIEKRARGIQESIERMYMPRDVGGRGFISFELMYKMTKISIAVYLALTEDPMLKEVFKRERDKTSWKNPIREAEIAVEEVRHKLHLEEGKVFLDDVQLDGKPSLIRKNLPQQFKKWWNEMLIEEYKAKVVQSVIWKEVSAGSGEGFMWLKNNLTSQQIVKVLRIQEQMVPNKGLDRVRGKQIEDVTCRLCKKNPEGVKHWLNSCEYLAKIEYLKRHDQTLRVFYAEVLKKYGLEPSEARWYKIPVVTVRENENALVIWNLRIPTHSPVPHRWPDLRIEDKKVKCIWVVDMSCPGDINVKEKEGEKKRNYAELVIELRMQRPGWRVIVMPLVVGVTGGISKLPQHLNFLFNDEKTSMRCMKEMQKTTVLGSVQMISRIECHLI